MSAFEDSWWYQGRADVVRRVLSRFSRRTSASAHILDLGAGYGGMANLLAQFGTLDGVEPDATARARLGDRGYRSAWPDMQAIPHSERFDLVALLDVLEHVEDDFALLQDVRMRMQPGGQVIITVPAYQFLFGEHDAVCHHFRRYTEGRLRAMVMRAGFEVVYGGYWNMTLLLPTIPLRLLGFSGDQSLVHTNLATWIMRLIVRTESRVIPHVRLPFGTSIVLLARVREVPPS